MNTDINLPATLALEAKGLSRPGLPSKTLRAACDRCHSQKLRCLRQGGQDKCERCHRLKTACRFGLRASRSLKRPEPEEGWRCSQSLEDLPSLLTPPNDRLISGFSESLDFELLNSQLDPSNIESAASESQEDLYPEHLKGIQELQVPDNDWTQNDSTPTGFDLLLEHTSNAACFVAGSNSMIRSLGIPHSPEIPHPYLTIENTLGKNSVDCSPESLFEKLATLNLALYKCSVNLSSMTKEKEYSSAFHSREANIFAIDEVLRLTHEFVNVMKDFCSIQQTETSLDPGLPSTSSPLTSYLQLSAPACSSGSESSRGRHFDRTDEPTTALLFSTHSLLSTIYTSLLGMMAACLEFSHSPSLASNWTIILPNLQVGSLTAPVVRVDAHNPIPDSSSYMFMILMLTERFWKQILDSLGRGGDFGVGVRDVMWSSMSSKSAEILKTVCEIKRMM